jgi:hypothetical protein
MQSCGRVVIFLFVLFVLFLVSAVIVNAEDGQISVTIPVGIYDLRQTSSYYVGNICQKSVTYKQNNDPAFKKNILLLGAFVLLLRL